MCLVFFSLIFYCKYICDKVTIFIVVKRCDVEMNVKNERELFVCVDYCVRDCVVCREVKKVERSIIVNRAVDRF